VISVTVDISGGVIGGKAFITEGGGENRRNLIRRGVCKRRSVTSAPPERGEGINLFGLTGGGHLRRGASHLYMIGGGGGEGE